MCDPLTIAGLTLTAGATVANTVANNRVQRARNDMLAAERIRQGKFDQEADALNAQSLDRYSDFGGDQASRASELGQYFTDQQIENQDQNASAVAQQVIPQSGSNVVLAEEARKRGEARAYADQQGEALGDLRSFGDLLGSVGREQARDASSLGQIAGFKRGSANVLPLELEAANGAGAGLKLFGDVLGLGGSIATSAGLGGKSFGDIANAFGGNMVSLPATAPVPPPRPMNPYSLYGG